MKTCSKCKEEKPLDSYHAKPAGRLGKHSICKKCRSAQSTQWNLRNRERSRQIQRDHKRKMRSSEEGKKRLGEINAAYYRGNRDKVNSYYRNRRKTDPLFSAKCRYRNLLSKALDRKRIRKNSVSSEVLGCDWDFLKCHIERQFTKGMSWEAFQRGEIHIDHIVPLATAKTEADVIALNHVTNLRPMWAKDNLSKGDRQTNLI